MEMLFNRLYDLRKIAGGSGGMFWKGGLPGLGFKLDPNARPMSESERTDFMEHVANYANGLQRYITLQGIEAQSLAPQVADPKGHVDIQLELIAIAIGCPTRIFMGSEQAKLAADKDSSHWNKRISKRRNRYLSPFVIRPTVDRLIAVGVLPEPDDYDVFWPDAETPTEVEQTDVLVKKVEAFSKYIAGGVDQLIPPEVFLSMFVGLEPDQVKEIIKAGIEQAKKMEEVAPPPQETIPNEDNPQEEGENEPTPQGTRTGGNVQNRGKKAKRK
jgi:hypothetical protein